MTRVALHPQDKVDSFTQAGWWSTETIDDLFQKQVQERADDLAVADPPNRPDHLDGEPRRLTWSELGDRVDQLASVLVDRGLGTGDVIAVQLPNSVELVESLLAIFRIGAVASPMPVQFREHEQGQLGALAEVRAVITASRIGDRRNAEAFVGLRSEIPTLDHVLAWGDGVPEGAESLDDLVPAADTSVLGKVIDAPQFDANSLATICWTSGTEAAPKGVLRASHDWIAIAWASVDAASLTADDILLNPFPMVNMAGIGGMLIPWLLTGATLHQHQPFDLPTFLMQIAKERVTYSVAPPALLNLLLAKEEILAQADVSSVRVLGSGSAPLSGWMIAGWRDKHGIDVTNMFGSNEGIALCGDPDTIPDPQERAEFFPRFGAEGFEWPNRAAAGMRTRLVDLETDEVITEAGTPGELRLAGATVFGGYLKQDELGLEPFDADGFFRTGDVFELAADDDGELRFYRFVDRAKDLIIRGGMNISPAEVEGLIQSHPAVVETAVVGYPDDVLGEKVCAFVVTAEGQEVSLDDIVEHLRGQNVASYKLPERIEVVDALPRNPVGKLLKRELRDGLSA